MAAYPGDLKLLLDGFAINVAQHASRTAFESGAVRQALLPGRTRHTASCSANIDDSDYDDWHTWSRGRALSYFTYDGMPVGERKVRIVAGSLQEVRGEMTWLASFDLEWYE